MKKLFLSDSDALLLNKKERTLYFILLVFFFALYMPGVTWLYNVCMWVFFVYSFFFNTLAEKWKLLKERKALLVIMLFFLLNVASALMSKDSREGISFVGLRISLFVIPLSIGSLYFNSALKDRIVSAFANATFCAAAGCLCWGVYRAITFHDASLLYNDNLTDIINFQSIYFAMLVNLAIFCFIYLLIKNPGLVNKNAIVPVLLLLFVIHFLLASRIAIIILYTSVIVFAFGYLLRKKKILEGVTLLMGLLLGSFLLVKFFPKTINRFKELSYTKFDYRSNAKESHFNGTLTADQWNGANIRIAVWECAWTVIKENMVVGTGLGDKMEQLKKQYAVKGFSFGIQSNRNTHNNYLDVWMSLGLIGLIVFMTGFFILPFYNCVKYSDWLGGIILISFMVSLFTETYMDRTMGNTLLGFFLAFIESYKKPVAAENY